eukprot:TRINITY_DN1094_c0_g1_i1.p1 TRINITY_DN1094_c0_g1~~TRINITY_DN1094_c0_g1_i1.p1  ORF type:complete len:621 (+),score=187.58 TRINITY_DN1094_c0_g1_i1:72-1934(+)
MKSTVRAIQKRALSYKAPAKEINFLFNDVLDMQEHYKTLPEGVSEECTPEFLNDVIDASNQLASEALLPCYMSGDDGCVWKNGDVTTPKGFKEAFEAYKEGGWQALNFPSEYGGMNMPLSLSLVKNEICSTANWAWFMYPGLTLGCTNTIIAHGSQEMKDEYLPKLIDLTYTGSMCLTEPHCGTDLAQIKTKALPNDDGSYALSGTKIFISAGEHDLAENIVHIVLAKLPDAPSGTKGISLFLVPKYLKKEDGSLETTKNVTCGGLEKKMGIHGNATAQLHFEDAKGWLIGEPHDGLRQMFTFMNTARIGTGVQGLAHMELAFQNAVAYANERMSMRALSGKKEKDKVADALVFHGDVRKNLMTAKALLEGSRALLYDISKQGDKITYALAAGDHVSADKIENDMGFLTPIVKGCVTEWAIEVTYGCQQVFGGHGYIKDHGMEQIVRDARISTLYEGTTGIQGLDMLGRKMMIDKLKLFSKWNKVYRDHAWGVMTSSSFKQEGIAMYKLLWQWKKDVVMIGLRAAKNRDAISASSVDHLFNAGYIVLGHYWLRMAIAAEKKLAAPDLSETDKKYYQSKIDTMRYYFSHIINRVATHRVNMTQPCENLYKIDRDSFMFHDL